MRTPLEIVTELKHVTEWSRPNMAFEQTMALLNELEEAILPSQPEPVVAEIVEVVEIVDVPEIPETENISIEDMRPASNPTPKIGKRPVVKKTK
jgi:hypothetical protein